MSDVKTVSSTKPFCLFRIGRTFSWIVFASSCDFPVLVVISTTRVNIHVLLSLTRSERNPVAGATGEQRARVMDPRYAFWGSRSIARDGSARDGSDCHPAQLTGSPRRQDRKTT